MIVIYILILGTCMLTFTTDDANKVPFMQAILQSIPTSVVIFAIGYGIYYYSTVNKKRKQEAMRLARQKDLDEKERAYADQKQKDRLAGKMACKSCGAPVSTSAKFCPFCGIVNENYKDS